MNSLNQLFAPLKSRGLIHIVVIIFFVSLVYWLKKEAIPLLLNGDEAYYADPMLTEKSPWDWPTYSFGHPPGWVWFNKFIYSIFGTSSEVAHWVGISFACMFLVSLYLFLSTLWSIPLSILFTTMVFFSDSYMLMASLNYPVIATAMFGFISILYLIRGNDKAFSLFNVLAICLRESAIVFTLAGAVLYLQKKAPKKLLWLLFPLLTFAFFYIWYAFSKSEFMLNPAFKDRAQKGFELIVLDKEKIRAIFEYYRYFFNALGGAAKFISPFCLLFLLLKRKMATRFYKDPYVVSGTIIFLVHSFFFALYDDIALRDTFISAVGVFLVMGRVFSYAPSYFFIRSAVPLILCLTIFIWNGRNLKRISTTPYLVKSMKVLQSSFAFIEQIDIDGLDILAVYPMDKFLIFPRHGYVKKRYPVRSHIKNGGVKRIGEPDIIITYSFRPPDDLSTFLKEREEDYELIKRFGEMNQFIKIYKKKKLLVGDGESITE